LQALRNRNAEYGLTGYLHYEDGQFYQWLEGPGEALKQIAALIEADPCHSCLEYLWRGEQAERQFAGWRAGFVGPGQALLFDWIAENGVQVGDGPSFARGLLGFMREAAQMAST
jgi:hypothetical protein